MLKGGDATGITGTQPERAGAPHKQAWEWFMKTSPYLDEAGAVRS